VAARRLRHYSLTCGAMARQALSAKPRQRPLDVLLDPSRAHDGGDQADGRPHPLVVVLGEEADIRPVTAGPIGPATVAPTAPPSRPRWLAFQPEGGGDEHRRGDHWP
jgi:hypothetical protein